MTYNDSNLLSLTIQKIIPTLMILTKIVMHTTKREIAHIHVLHYILNKNHFAQRKFFND